MLVHNLADRDTDQAATEGSQGKRLLAVLCGHEHSRAVTKWGGVPMIVGGAVFLLPGTGLALPARPLGLRRLSPGRPQLEHAYLDWAAERSVDLKSPAWRTIVATPRLNVEGTVSDFGGSVRRVICRLGRSQAEGRLTRVGRLTDRFEATLDVSGLADGVYDLTIDATHGLHSCCHTRPLIVKNGRSEPLAAGRPRTEPAAQPVRLKFQVGATRRTTDEVRLNGRPLARRSGIERAVAGVVVRFAVRPLAAAQPNHDRARREKQARRLAACGSSAKAGRSATFVSAQP